MPSVFLILAGLGLMCLSGLPACLMSRKSPAGQRLTTALLCAGSLAGLAGTAMAFAEASPPSLELPWALPWGGFAVAVDPLSAFFLCLVFTIPALGSVYGLGYWKQAEHEENGQRLGLFYGLLAGGMAMVLISRDAILFMIAWEIMALSAYFAATAEDDKPEVRQAGWIYLVATHIGTLVLIAMFALWRGATGSFSLVGASGVVPLETAGVIFGLATLGFGFKAGLMPLHIWLPGAHANAPSHVSAVMSGVMLKMGIYGILRMSGLLPACEPWWGILLLVVGAVGGILGIAYALGQRDIKRVLAYSSIENVGIIAMGMGLALLGRAFGRPELAVLGMGGALLHVWNHGLFKSLLFMDAGAVIHAAGGRDTELMGGLGKRMPRASFLFAIGAIAICALPPLNGFAGEWLLYLGLFKTLDPGGAPGLAMAGLAAVALAMIGALAVAAFVKLYGSVFLGARRDPGAKEAHDAPGIMVAPMALLAAACLAIGLFPMITTPVLEAATGAWTCLPGIAPSIADMAPQRWISYFGLGLGLVAALLWLRIRIALRKRPAVPGITWDCGYSRPDARMQYTATSFAQILVKLFSAALRPITRLRKPEGAFPGKASFETSVPDSVLDRLVLPVFDVADKILPKVKVFQQGQTYLYVLYILVITIALLVMGAAGVAI